MPIQCPECHATLTAEDIAPDQAQCPFCTAELTELPDPETSPETSIVDEAPRDAIAREVPSGSYEVVERSPERLVLHLPAAKSTGGIGFFALIWNVFITIFTSVFAFAAGKDEIDSSPWAIAAFLSVFWLTGFGLIVVWVRMRFTRLFLLLEKDRLVIQRKIFRTSNRELILGAAPRASLEEAYSSNEVKVYQLVVRGEGASEKFGVALSPPVQQLLMREINDFLGVETLSITPLQKMDVCSFCGVQLPGDPEPDGFIAAENNHTLDFITEGETDPSHIPKPRLCAACQAQSEASGQTSLWEPLSLDHGEQLPEGLVVEDHSPERWAFRYPLIMAGAFRTYATIFAGFMVLVAAGMGGMMFSNIAPPAGQPLGFLFLIAPLLFISMPLLTAGCFLMAVRGGRIIVELTPKEVRLRWGWGLVSIKKNIPIESVTDCRIMTGMRTTSESSFSRRTQTVRAVAALRAQGVPYPLPLTTTHNTEFAQKVVRLIRTYWSEELRQPLPD